MKEQRNRTNSAAVPFIACFLTLAGCQQPPGTRGDYGIDLMMRIYAPDLERYKTWSPPQAERMK